MGFSFGEGMLSEGILPSFIPLHASYNVRDCNSYGELVSLLRLTVLRSGNVVLRLKAKRRLVPDSAASAPPRISRRCLI